MANSSDNFHIKNKTTGFPAPVTPSVLKSNLLTPALTSHFQCWFSPPGSVISWASARGFNYNGNEEFVSLSCSEASLPGSSLTTNEINDDHTGVTERHAYRRQYDDRADFTFYVDHGRPGGSYDIIWFFENWIAYIVNEERNTTYPPPLDKIVPEFLKTDPNKGINNPNYTYRINYPDTYRSTIYLNKFEKDYESRYLRYDFLQAYPISINSMPISYESSQLLKCTVSFTYTRYVINRVLVS